MKLAGSTALVTGAKPRPRPASGPAAHRPRCHCLRRGPQPGIRRRAPARSRSPLDITDPASVDAAAKATGNVTVLINNAGSLIGGSFLQSPIEDIRREMETHYFGTPGRHPARFAPAGSPAAGTSAVLNVLSVMSWYTSPENERLLRRPKSAEWSLTNAFASGAREPGPQQVSALHVGYIDTDMARPRRRRQERPPPPLRSFAPGMPVEAGQIEILADDHERQHPARGLAAGGQRASTRSSPDRKRVFRWVSETYW